MCNQNQNIKLMKQNQCASDKYSETTSYIIRWMQILFLSTCFTNEQKINVTDILFEQMNIYHQFITQISLQKLLITEFRETWYTAK